MNVAIVHHHLYPGGVSRVIQSQIAALGSTPVSLLIGDEPDMPLPASVSVQICPALNYLEPESCSDIHIGKTYDILTSFLQSYLTPDSVIHAHNAGLGKNPVLTVVLNELVRSGRPLLHHCHDFAEDRPVNLAFLKQIVQGHFNLQLSDVLYPDTDYCRFAVLSSHDKDRLISSGINASRLHLLPNPVNPPAPPSRPPAELRDSLCRHLNLDPDKQIVTYPVRVIQRKNIGEFILLATLFSDSAHWLVTLPPNNPVDLLDYERWVSFCRDAAIPVHFAVSADFPFADIMYASDRVISTSIREGFGMTFLEPWLYQKPVVGRNLPSVIDGFIRNGIDFPFLYDCIAVPGRTDINDFPRLSITDQIDCISTCMRSSSFRSQFLTLNPQLSSVFIPVTNDQIAANARRITTAYSLEKYGNHLHSIYNSFPA